MTAGVLPNVSCVAIDGRAVLIEGAPGSGKSTLALHLIDRGAQLIGDDGVTLEVRDGQLWTLPPPAIAGKLEVRGVGLLDFITTSAPLALAIVLGAAGPRLPEPSSWIFDTFALPCLPLSANEASNALRVEWALRVHGLCLPPGTG